MLEQSGHHVFKANPVDDTTIEFTWLNLQEVQALVVLT